MSLSIPVFPGFKPGQSFTPPGVPVRAPTWNYKEGFRYNNDRQPAVNGRVTVIKYWPNPLRTFEWRYGYMRDDPTNLNSFYPHPIGATDFRTLLGFYTGMQAGGTEFAFQPPNNVVMRPYIGSTVQVANNIVTFSGLLAGAAAAIQPYIGWPLYAYNFSGASFLNGYYLPITGVNTTSNTVSCAFTHANYGPTADVGLITLGQVLGSPDSNNNIELVHTIGRYPTLPLPATPPFATNSNESVQLIDTTTLKVYDGQGSDLGGTYTLALPGTVAPYSGYVLEFGASAPAHLPVSAQFSFYYLCRFSDDTQEYENFLTMLWSASTVKFEQVPA